MGREGQTVGQMIPEGLHSPAAMRPSSQPGSGFIPGVCEQQPVDVGIGEVARDKGTQSCVLVGVELDKSQVGRTRLCRPFLL